MKKNKRFIGFVSVLIALIILVPVIGLFVMTSPEKKGRANNADIHAC